MKKAYPRLEEAFFKYKLIEGAVSPTKESYKRLSHYHYYRKAREKERENKAPEIGKALCFFVSSGR